MEQEHKAAALQVGLLFYLCCVAVGVMLRKDLLIVRCHRLHSRGTPLAVLE